MLFSSSNETPQLKITHLNKQQQNFVHQLEKATHSQPDRPSFFQRFKNRKKNNETKPFSRLFVLDFNGDIQASAVTQLRQEINALLQFANAEHDKILIRLESPGGLVQNYGLAASQLARIRETGIELWVTVDKVAASGGYLMAAVANKIFSAPFAVVGSIGVVAQVPNFHKLLEKNQIDFNVYTAGKFKRTVTLFGENTAEGEEKFREELEETHQQFKDYLSYYRPVLDLEKVATGEHWLAKDGLTLNLVDELTTSDAVIANAIKDNIDVYQVKLEQKASLMQKFKLLPTSHLNQLTTHLLSNNLFTNQLLNTVKPSTLSLATAVFSPAQQVSPIHFEPGIYMVDPFYGCLFYR